MFNPTRRLIVDIKVQDKLRKLFASNNNFVSYSCIEFGDSDVDYRLSFDATKIRVLNAPYSLQGIKNKLAYSGLLTGVLGELSVYKRYINDNGIVESYYGYPGNTVLSPGNTPPVLANGFNSNNLQFIVDGSLTSAVREGWIVYLQSLPLGFVDENGNQLRYIEPYEITFSTALPAGYEYIEDTVNGSFCITRDLTTHPLTTTTSIITIRGVYSRLTTQLTINI